MRGEEKREGDGNGRVRGSGRVRGTRTRTREQVRFFCPYLCIILFLLFCFSISQVSSASSPPPPMQTGKGVPLNDFSWASPAPDVVGVAAVNNMLERCLVAAVDHATARRREPRLSNGQHRCTPRMRWLCYLEGVCLRPLMRQRCGLAPVPYLVIRCGSVPKVGTVPLLDLHYS